MSSETHLIKISQTAYKARIQEARMGYFLIIIALCLLPLERIVIPYRLGVVDFAFVVLIVYLFLRMVYVKQRIFFPLVGPFYLILLASLIATLSGLSVNTSLMAVFQEIYLYLAFIALVNVLSTFTLTNLERLMKFWSIVAVVIATTVVMGMIRIGPSAFYTAPVTGRVISLEGMNRGLGTFVNPNAGAVYLSISFFILLATNWSTRLRITIGAWLLVGIFATGSMGAMVSTIVGFSFLILFNILKRVSRPHRVWILWLIFCLAIILILTLIIIFVDFPSFFTFRLGNSEILSFAVDRLPGSFADRLMLIESSWPYYLQYPMGTGPNSFSTFIGTLHNDYVAFFFERGPLGFIGWIWLILSTLRSAFRSVKKQSDSWFWPRVALGSGFLGVVLNALSHEISHFRQVWVLMAFIFAISFYSSEHSNQQTTIHKFD